MTTLTSLAIVLPLASMVFDGAKLPQFSNRKVGGIRFIRLGRLQLSFCVVRK